MVARIAPEPISTSVAVSEFRSRAPIADVGTQPVDEDPLPPVLAPVPTPVPAPAIVSPSEAFATALLVEQMPQQAVSPNEVLRRLTGGWQAPESELHLADRQV